VNIFNKDLGVHQGRIRKSDAPGGAFVYELGHALMRDAFVKIGDYHEITQTFMMNVNAKHLRASIVVQTPSILPVGQYWEVSGWLNGTKVVSRRLQPSKRKLVLDDWRISLLGAATPPGTNTVAFRLELVA
jgi:hypothetical protein